MGSIPAPRPKLPRPEVDYMEIADIVLVYVDCIKTALPFTFIFWACDMITCTILRTAFGGKLSFKAVG